MKATEILKTEEAIHFVKETFSRELAASLHLVPVSCPLIVAHDSGINDDLNGVEMPVRFRVAGFNGQDATVVQSLAKWKRLRLLELGIEQGKGILTDMRALRPDESIGPLHSVYVDQWDWENHISVKDRTLQYLRETVEHIYKVLRLTEEVVCMRYDGLSPILPERIHFIHTDELLERYPSSSPRERETRAAREFGAIFIIGVGHKLPNGEPHDGKAPDYDDWSSVNEVGKKGLNGDIIVWNPVLETGFEISSMGIRVSPESLLRQLEIRGCPERQKLPFHRMLLSGMLPQSIGGGIGQSRVCMFMLRKRHIGEVQVGYWPSEYISQAEGEGIYIL